MNKISITLGVILLILVILGAAGYSFYQNQTKNYSTVNNQETSTSEQVQQASKCRTGELATVRDGKMFWGSLSNQAEVGFGNATLSDGTLVYANGEVIKKDKTRIILKEGETYYVELPGPCPSIATSTYQGKVTEYNTSGFQITGEGYGSLGVNVDLDTKILDEKSNVTNFAYIKKGFIISVTQSPDISKMGDGAITAAEIRVISK